MDETIAIRRAAAGDWAAVAEVHALSWRSAYRGIYPDSFLDGPVIEDRKRHWRRTLRRMNADEDAVFVAEQAGRSVGFACLRRLEPGGPLLDNLHVLPERKGQGIGRALIAHAAGWLVEKEPDAPLQLLVWEANAPARRFYAGLGGEEVGSLRCPIPGGGRGTEIRMVWPRAAVLAAPP